MTFIRKSVSLAVSFIIFRFTELMNELQFICPRCASPLAKQSAGLLCQNQDCASAYPIVNNIPVLINESNSVFRISDYTAQKTGKELKSKSVFAGLFYKLLPEISANVKAAENYRKFAGLVKGSVTANVLVIGGAEIGAGMNVLLADNEINMVESDVYFSQRVSVIFDAHNIPYPDSCFDGIIIQAVLEHVADPYACVDEIYRVLKKDGIVYAEIPFMQQHHLGAADFTRFSSVGIRRLFRYFTEIDCGPVCGPGMALAWSIFYFFASFTSNLKIREIIRIIVSCLTFFLKYFDRLLINKPGAADAASGFFFLGRKSDKCLDDREILSRYRGLVK